MTAVQSSESHRIPTSRLSHCFSRRHGRRDETPSCGSGHVAAFGVRNPTPEREADIEKADTAKPGIAQQPFVVLGSENRQTGCDNDGPRILRLRRFNARGYREGGVPCEPQVTIAGSLRKAEVGDREGCAGLQATPDLPEGAQANGPLEICGGAGRSPALFVPTGEALGTRSRLGQREVWETS